MIPDLPIEELARRYNNGAAVPDWQETLLPRWQRESERVRDVSIFESGPDNRNNLRKDLKASVMARLRAEAPEAIAPQRYSSPRIRCPRIQRAFSSGP